VSIFGSPVFEFILDLWACASYFSVKLVLVIGTWPGLRVAFVKLVFVNFFHQHLLHLPSGSSLRKRVLPRIDLSGIHGRMLNNPYPLTTSLPSRSLTWLTIHASRCSHLLRRVIHLRIDASFFRVIMMEHLGDLSSLHNAFRHFSTNFILCRSCMVDNASATCWPCFGSLIHNIASNPSMLIWWLITLDGIERINFNIDHRRSIVGILESWASLSLFAMLILIIILDCHLGWSLRCPWISC